MTDNPYRGQGQGRPGDDYYDDPRYNPAGRPQEEPRAGAPDPRAPHPPEPGGYPPQGEPNYPPRPAYPEGGYPDQAGYPPSYEQRPPAGYGPPSGGYEPGYRPGPAGPGGYPGPQGGYGQPPATEYDYGRPEGRPEGRPPGRHEEPGYGRPGYPDQGGYEQQGYPGGQYPRQDYAQPEYGRYPDAPAGYDYGQPPAAGGYAGGYGQPEYPAAAGGPAITLQLDDGSGRTYQLREGANVVGRGQDAQFRLPDTGVSRRHLEIRWDGQVALLSDLNSTNGTTVNNAPVQEWQLADGDVIRLGHSEIVVRVH